MRPLTILLTALIITTVSCKNNSTAIDPLAKEFIQSLKDGKINTLEEHYPTVEFFKTLYQKGKERVRTDQEIDSFLQVNNRQIKADWNEIRQRIKNKNIDPDKIKIKETLVFDPYDGEPVQAMVVVYEYDNKTWDDLVLTIKHEDKKTYFLEIHGAEKAFSFSDESMTMSSIARTGVEIKQPEFQKSINARITQMIDWAKGGNIKDFSAFVAYKGDDKSRQWKSAVNMSDSTENKMAKELMEYVVSAMGDCSTYSFDKLTGEASSERYEIKQPLICGAKIVKFNLVKVKDKLLLVDVYAE